MAEKSALQTKVYDVIFGTETPAGRRFDLLLITAILLSVLAILLDSIEPIHNRYGSLLISVEWFFTLLFTYEYIVRIWCAYNPKAYIKSFYGVVDLLSVLPTYIALLIPGANLLLVVRLLRVLRIFRVLKLFQYMSETQVLLRSLLMARRKILIFLFSVLILVTIFGSLMYLIEGPKFGFSSIPRSIYWAIVTVTTVGYGDITPGTTFGQIIAALAMLTGYAIIAVPTGIISAEIISEIQKQRLTIRCSNCERAGHETDAKFCRHCGTELPKPTVPET